MRWLMKVPEPRTRRTSSLSSSSCMADRAAARLTPNRVAISCSLGTRSPGVGAREIAGEGADDLGVAGFAHAITLPAEVVRTTCPAAKERWFLGKFPDELS